MNVDRMSPSECSYRRVSLQLQRLRHEVHPVARLSANSHTRLKIYPHIGLSNRKHVRLHIHPLTGLSLLKVIRSITHPLLSSSALRLIRQQGVRTPTNPYARPSVPAFIR